MFDAPLALDAELEQRIRDDRLRGWTNPYRTPDAAVIRRRRLPRDRQTLLRPAYVRDIEKIINIAPYNRYAGKTQVFSFVQNDDISRRALHVQFVGRIARDIARPLGLNLDLTEAIALGHDIGHTPFGHAGERCLDSIYLAYTGRHFAHNVHSVEVLDRMYGRNISLQTLDGILCHNGEYEKREFRLSGLNSFDAFDQIVDECIRCGDTRISTLEPSTLEACVVRISDIIAYVGKDRQDAEKVGLIDKSTLFETGEVGTYNSWVINALVVDIVANSYAKDHIEMSRQAFEELKRAKRENYELIYNTREVGGECMDAIEPLFAALYVKMRDDLCAHNTESPIFAYHIEPVVRQARFYDHDYDWQSDHDRCVMDFISSLTDNSFLALCNMYVPDLVKRVPFKGYFGQDPYPEIAR